MESASVGKRISVDGYYGTIKFIGSVPPTKGDWLGVDWDDPDRGKHDGSRDGVQYFNCQCKTSGSFVRPQKANYGVNICDAIRERYTSAGDDSYDCDVYFGTKKTITVGMDKVQKTFEKLDSLKDLGLRGLNVSSAGEPGSLGAMVPSVVSVNISQNLFSYWSTIYQVILELPLLNFLSISENRITMDVIDEENTIQPKYLKTLVANKCHFTWSDIICCCQSLPSLKKLVVAANSITSIGIPLNDMFTHLNTLDLSENKLSSWDEVRKLKDLPELTNLLLVDCGLDCMHIDVGDFPKLMCIFISNNKFQDYVVFDELNKLISLEELHVRNIPVFEKEKDYATAEGIIIAKISNLKLLNRSSVDSIQRQSAELDYLKAFAVDWRKNGGHQNPNLNKPSADFLKAHPCYMKLVSQYGALEDHQIIKKSTALKNNLIEVIIDAHLIKPQCPLINKKLPLSMKIGNLKILLRRLTKIDIRDQRLVYISKDNQRLEVEMFKDDESLHDISIEPGDIIQIRSK